MKKLLLTASAALTILFAQAQQCQADFSYMQNGPTTIFTDLSTVNPSWSTNYSVHGNGILEMEHLSQLSKTQYTHMQIMVYIHLV